MQCRHLTCKQLDLTGSHLNGMTAPHLEIAGDVLLDDMTSTAPLDFTGAKIGGKLSLHGACLETQNVYALDLEGAEITQALTFSPYDACASDTHFSARGGIKLNEATIGGLYAEHVTITQRRSQSSETDDINALNANNIVIKGNARLNHAKMSGAVILTGADIGGYLACENATFQHSGRYAFKAARMNVSQLFMWKDITCEQGRIDFRGAHAATFDDSSTKDTSCTPPLLDGFTYDRIRADTATFCARKEWLEGGSTGDNPAKVWSGDLPPKDWKPAPDGIPWKTLAPGRDWETFNPIAYAADIAIPLVSFGQTEAWAPSTTRQGKGLLLWWLRWIVTVCGWIVTALGAAAITGIIRRE